MFRRQQIEDGGRLLKQGDVGLAGVSVCAENEVEIIAGMGSGLFNTASVTVHLRLREDGALTMTSHCTCVQGTLCQHAAALMLMLDIDEGRQRIEKMARVQEKASPAPDEPAGDEPTETTDEELSSAEPKPVLVIDRSSWTALLPSMPCWFR